MWELINHDHEVGLPSICQPLSSPCICEQHVGSSFEHDLVVQSRAKVKSSMDILVAVATAGCLNPNMWHPSMLSW